MPDLPRPSRPERIGRYRVLDRIGRGAMGVVYAAHDDVMERDVAVKVMMTDLEASPTSAPASCARHRSPRASRTAASSLSTTSAKTTAGRSSSWSCCAGRHSRSA